MSNWGSGIDRMKWYQTLKAGTSVGAGLHNVLREKKGSYHSAVRINREKSVVLWFRVMPHLAGSSEHLNFCPNRYKILSQNAISVGMRRRSTFFLCMCGRNCIIIIIMTKPKCIISSVNKNQIYSTYPMFIFVKLAFGGHCLHFQVYTINFMI